MPALEDIPKAPTAASSAGDRPAAKRFTLDGDDGLGAHISEVCSSALRAVQDIVPRKRLDALVLAGGYGRGEGGVLRTANGDRPYNDLEFFVFVRGNRFLNRRKFQRALSHAAESIAQQALVDVEFHIISIDDLRQSSPSMFYYDLLAGHHMVWGSEESFAGTQHHLGTLPMAEATRLLMNRGTGLLLARERLARSTISDEDRDFVARNIAKAQLALGDAVLTALGLYHWSCRERNLRLGSPEKSRQLPWLEEVRQHHAIGVDFKLHPSISTEPPEHLRQLHGSVLDLMLPVWLWLESKRLGREFSSARRYAIDPVNKCPETSAWRNRLLNVRLFGAAALFWPRGYRHPRERILNAISLFLWEKDDTLIPAVLALSPGTDAEHWLAWYLKLWESVR